LKFLGRVAAVLVANLITLVFLAVVFALLISDQGQSFMRDLGYDVSPLAATYHQSRIKEWRDPRSGKMTPINVSHQPLEPAPVQPKPAPKTVDKGPDPHTVQTTLNTCTFWNNEYRKDGSDRSKGFRDTACARYESLSGNDISNVIALAQKPQQRSSSQGTTNTRNQQAAADNRRHKAYCQQLKDKIEHYDAKLRAGGNGNYMTYWRGERRKVSDKYAWECLRG